MQVAQLSYAVGAEIRDIDISRAIPQQQFDRIYAAFLEYGVLLFRNQHLDAEQHIAFSRRFGETDRHDVIPKDRHPDYPELIVVTNVPHADGTPSATRRAGRVWHSDLSFTLAPSKGSVLRSVTIPPIGGDTMFSNMYMAYEALSDGMKKMLEGLHGIHRPAVKHDVPGAHDAVAQPLVRVHPETGRKALYVGEKVSCIDGLTPAESQPLLGFLCSHIAQPEFIYRHRWQPHDVLLWDNRCTAHIALADFDEKYPRRMERTTLLGTPSGYAVE